MFKANNNKVVDNGGGSANKTVINLSKSNKSRNLSHIPNIGAIKESIFLTFNAKKAFNYLKQAFIKTPIF